MREIKFTDEQRDHICFMIGEWYISWKNRLINWEDKTHRLGHAKEILKVMICDTQQDVIKMIKEIEEEINKTEQ